MSQFDRYQLQLVYCGALPSEKSPARNFANHFDTFSQSQHLLHTLHKPFFAFQLRFYLSYNNKVYYAENVVYFLPSSILKWLHKNSPILISFF